MEENSQVHVKHLPLTQSVYAPGRADDWGGYSAHPEAPAGTVPWKNPYQSSQVPNQRLEIPSPEEEIGIVLRSTSLSPSPWKKPQKAQSTSREMTPAQGFGHWLGESFKGRNFMLQLLTSFPWIVHSESLHAGTKTWKKPSQQREPP